MRTQKLSCYSPPRCLSASIEPRYAHRSLSYPAATAAAVAAVAASSSVTGGKKKLNNNKQLTCSVSHEFGLLGAQHVVLNNAVFYPWGGDSSINQSIMPDIKRRRSTD